MATMRELKTKADEIGCTIELDEDGQCYRAISPVGKCWDQGLHELIAVFGPGVIGNDCTKEEARQDLLERMIEHQSLLDECSDYRDGECDYCNPDWFAEKSRA